MESKAPSRVSGIITSMLAPPGVAILLALPQTLLAAPNEIKVFTDELAGFEQETLETHVNIALPFLETRGQRQTVTQVMPEYSYGIWRNWEASLQLPVSWSQGVFYLNGIRGELQYVAPHNDTRGIYWGFNSEYAYSSPIAGERRWDLEFSPILGFRTQWWHFAANPNIFVPLSGNDKKPRFEPAAKAAYRTDERDYVGFEYYVEAGAISHLLPREQRSETLYVTWDYHRRGIDFNLGIGRGLTDSSDKWVVKLIFEIPVDFSLKRFFH